MARGPQVVALLAALLVALCSLAAAATSASAGGAPDSAARAALQARIGRLDRVRVLGPGGTTVLLAPVVREDGLHMGRPWKPPRAALFVSKDAPAPPRPVEFVPWSAIDGVQVHRSGTRSGAVTGAAIGVCVVGLTLMANHRQLAEEWDTAGTWIMAGSAIVVGGTTLAGSILGSFAEEWTPVYPPPPPRVRP